MKRERCCYGTFSSRLCVRETKNDHIFDLMLNSKYLPLQLFEKPKILIYILKIQCKNGNKRIYPTKVLYEKIEMDTIV